MAMVKPTLLQNLNRVDNQITQASNRISTGKRVNSALDDPIAFNRIAATRASVSQTAIKLNTLEYGIGRVDARDQVLDSMQETMMRFQELASMASSGIHKLTDIEPEMRALRETMISLANTKDASGLMFAGTSSVTPFVKDMSGSVVYVGSLSENVIDIDGVKLSGSVSGVPLLNAFAAMESVLANVNAGVPPSVVQVANVQNSVETILGMRTSAAAQAAGAVHIRNSLTARMDRETDQVNSMEAADETAEMIRYTEGQRQYEAILKVVGMELNRRRLMDYI